MTCGTMWWGAMWYMEWDSHMGHKVGCRGTMRWDMTWDKLCNTLQLQWLQINLYGSKIYALVNQNIQHSDIATG